MPQNETTEKVGPVPDPEQGEKWEDDYLWIWCAGHPKEAAAEIVRLREYEWMYKDLCK